MANGTIAQGGQAEEHAQELASSWSAPGVEAVGDDNTQAEAGATSTAEELFSAMAQALQALSDDAGHLAEAGQAIEQADEQSAGNF